jgi:hypothetical protein
LDGVIIKDKLYPKFGKVFKKARKFLERCRWEGIQVYIWTSRCNNPIDVPESNWPSFGSKSVIEVKRFLQKERLYYTDILLLPKPIGSHSGAAKIFFDDRTRPSLDLKHVKFGGKHGTIQSKTPKGR